MVASRVHVHPPELPAAASVTQAVPPLPAASGTSSCEPCGNSTDHPGRNLGPNAIAKSPSKRAVGGKAKRRAAMSSPVGRNGKVDAADTDVRGCLPDTSGDTGVTKAFAGTALSLRDDTSSQRKQLPATSPPPSTSRRQKHRRPAGTTPDACKHPSIGPLSPRRRLCFAANSSTTGLDMPLPETV